MKHVFILGFLFFAACATTRSYENSLVSWRGKSASQLIQKWGTPSQIDKLKDGGSVYRYTHQHPDRIQTENSRTPSNLSAVYDCQTEFLVDPESKIIGWRYQGPNCRAE